MQIGKVLTTGGTFQVTTADQLTYLVLCKATKKLELPPTTLEASVWIVVTTVREIRLCSGAGQKV